MTPDPITQAIEAMERVQNTLEYILGTISSGSRRPSNDGWPGIHEGRAGSSERQAEASSTEIRVALSALREFREKGIEGFIQPHASSALATFFSKGRYYSDDQPALLFPLPEEKP